MGAKPVFQPSRGAEAVPQTWGLGLPAYCAWTAGCVVQGAAARLGAELQMQMLGKPCRTDWP